MAAICRPTTARSTAAFNADTFRILKDTKHPDEAFEVLTYLLGDASRRPARRVRRHARPDGRPAGVLRPARTRRSPRQPDWQVAIDSIQFADNPNFESFMPAYNETLGLVGSGGKYRPAGRPRGPRHGRGVRGPARRDPGDLGQAALRLARIG